MSNRLSFSRWSPFSGYEKKDFIKNKTIRTFSQPGNPIVKTSWIRSTHCTRSQQEFGALLLVEYLKDSSARRVVIIFFMSLCWWRSAKLLKCFPFLFFFCRKSSVGFSFWLQNFSKNFFVVFCIVFLFAFVCGCVF